MMETPSFLVDALPSNDGQREIYADLLSEPYHDPKERLFPYLQRRRIVVRRLGSYFKPGMRQIRLYEEVLNQIREGYEGRARTFNDQVKRIRDAADLHSENRLIDTGTETAIRYTSKSIGLNNTSRSSVLLGTPGMGKSLTVEEVLRRIPQVVSHRAEIKMDQICWMKLDCPHRSSVKALCLDFFAEIDRVLGFDEPYYLRMYGTMRSTEEQMMSYMALVANLHAVGLLVVDEVQHLAGSDGNLLRFLVTLINKIGVPVMLIGTTDAIDVIGETARLARRGTGGASAIWDRYAETDHDWISFVDHLWQWQWTNIKTELSSSFEERIYYHSQGIIDLAVKLFTMAQLRAIRIGELTGRDERITVEMLNKVARDEMALVQPLLKAIRAGKRDEIRKWKDLTSLSEAIGNVIRADLHSQDFELPKSNPAPQQPALVGGDGAVGNEILERIFVEIGIASDIGADLLNDIRADDPDASLGDIIIRLQEVTKPSKPKKQRSSKRPRQTAPEIPMPDDDVRQIVARGAEDGQLPYLSLTAAGLAGPPSYFRTAA